MSEAHTQPLAKLTELRAALSEPPSEEAFAKWWNLVQSIEFALQDQRGGGQREEGLMHDLRTAVSDIIAAHSRNLNPYVGRANVIITALESSLKKRTTGTDGWPLA